MRKVLDLIELGPETIGGAIFILMASMCLMAAYYGTGIPPTKTTFWKVAFIAIVSGYLIGSLAKLLGISFFGKAKNE